MMMNIVVLSVRTFRNCVVGHECFFKKSILKLWTIHKSIPPEYDKSNTGIRTDPEENM